MGLGCQTKYHRQVKDFFFENGNITVIQFHATFCIKIVNLNKTILLLLTYIFYQGLHYSYSYILYHET